MASRTGCMKVGVKIKPLSPLTPSISHTAIQRSESLTIIAFSPYRGDVLVRSGLLVVTWREIPGLHRVQWHPGPHHRVQLVWRWAVPQHCLHPLSKGGTSRHSLCNSSMPVYRLLLLFYDRELCSLCLILTISFFLSVQPGTPNPVVKVFVVDTDNTTDITQVNVPAEFQNR